MRACSIIQIIDCTPKSPRTLEKLGNESIASSKKAQNLQGGGGFGRNSAWRNRAPGPHAHRNTARQAMDGLWTQARGQSNSQTTPATTNTSSICQLLGAADGTPCHIQHSPNTPTTGLRERGNNTSKSTGCSGRQKAATRHNMRREERVTVQGPVKQQKSDGMSHRAFATGIFHGGKFRISNVCEISRSIPGPLCEINSCRNFVTLMHHHPAGASSIRQ